MSGTCPIKIAHITTVASSLRHLSLNLLQSLQGGRGYEVAAISSPGPEVKIIEAHGIRHIAIPMTRRMTPFADLHALWKLYRLMRREQFTIVHTHTPKANLLGQLAARLAGIPVRVSTVHGLYFTAETPAVQRTFFHVVETWSAKFADTVFLVNDEDLQTVRTRGICLPDKLRLLGNGIGIDVSRFGRAGLNPMVLRKTRADLGLPEDCKVVGFVGRLVAEKGVPELLQAARIVRQRYQHVRVLIVGPIDHGKSDAVTPDLARKYGVEDICVFTGSRTDMEKLYALMDVFVLPSHREGCSRVVMEAAAMALPCVVTAVRGCREMVDHEKTGLVVPRGDQQGLAAAIVRLLENPGVARKMGERARKIAVKRFDERPVFEQIKAEYGRLLNQKGVAAPLGSLRPVFESAR